MSQSGNDSDVEEIPHDPEDDCPTLSASGLQGKLELLAARFSAALASEGIDEQALSLGLNFELVCGK